jgi:hypothetical protein
MWYSHVNEEEAVRLDRAHSQQSERAHKIGAAVPQVDG